MSRGESRMKGGKDEEIIKQYSNPLFPRIHISEADRGGPRAPPRNKMALCEQHHTMPCHHHHRLTTTTSAATSAPPNHHTLQASCHMKNPYSPFCSGNGAAVFPGSHGSATRHHHPLHDMRSSAAPTSYQTVDATNHHCPTASEFKTFQPYCYFSTNSSSAEKNREQDEFRFPSCHQSSSSGKHLTTFEKQMTVMTSFRDIKVVQAVHSNYSGPHQISNHQTQKLISIAPTRKERDARDAHAVGDRSAKADSTVVEYLTKQQVEANFKVLQTRDSQVNSSPACFISANQKISTDATSNLLPRNATVQPNSNAVFSTKTHMSHDVSTHLDQDCKNLQEHKATSDCRRGNSEMSIRKRNASAMEGPSCSFQQLGFKHDNSSRPTSNNECQCHNGQACGSAHAAGAVSRSDGVSDTSLAESITSFAASPEDVVKVIGRKRFCMARRTMIHQQRIYAAQVFELHKLLKVQRWMAESPEMFSEDNLNSRNPSIKAPSIMNLDENIQDKKGNLQQPNPSISREPDVLFDIKRQPLPNIDTQRFLNIPQPSLKPSAQTLMPPPTAADSKSAAPLCFHPLPAGNQWLIPVRSPSEGLIYKPYTGPLPPPVGFLAPVYDGCRPINLNAGGDNFLDTSYYVSVPNQQGAGNSSSHVAAPRQPYFHPYAMPMINASGVNQTAKHSTAEHEAAVRKCETSPVMIPPYLSSCNNIPSLSQKCGMETDCDEPLSTSKGIDSEDCPTSRPPEKNKVDNALSLFPTEPSSNLSQQLISTSPTSEQQIQVIKVVPHSRKSASESAARIFRTIQEERKQHE